MQTGYWEGEGNIVRDETAEERLLRELRLNDRGTLAGKSDKEILEMVNLGIGLLGDYQLARLLI